VSEFWTVDSIRREIRVSTPDGLARAYQPGAIPLVLADNQTLAAEAVLEIE